MPHRYLFVFVPLLFCFPRSSSAAVVVPSVDTVPTPFRATEMTPEAFYDMDLRDMEQRVGRPLTRLERRLFYKAKRKAGRELPNYAQGEYREGNGFAIAGFVLGVVSILTLGIIGWLTGPLALIFSILGLEKSNRRGARHKGLAIAGIVMGGLITLIWVIVLGIIVLAFGL